MAINSEANAENVNIQADIQEIGRYSRLSEAHLAQIAKHLENLTTKIESLSKESSIKEHKRQTSTPTAYGANAPAILIAMLTLLGMVVASAYILFN